MAHWVLCVGTGSDGNTRNIVMSTTFACEASTYVRSASTLTAGQLNTDSASVFILSRAANVFPRITRVSIFRHHTNHMKSVLVESLKGRLIIYMSLT